MSQNPLVAAELGKGVKSCSIADILGRASSSVYAEGKNNGGPVNYFPSEAQARSVRFRARPKTRQSVAS
jgi:IS30 family transposase